MGFWFAPAAGGIWIQKSEFLVVSRDYLSLLKQRPISDLGWCTGVTARLPQFNEDDDDILPEGVGVASSSFSSSSVVRPGESSWQVRSSAEAQGALRPRGGSMSQFPDVSVLSPINKQKKIAFCRFHKKLSFYQNRPEGIFAYLPLSKRPL